MPAGNYRRVLPNDLVIASAQPQHAPALEALQRVVFPTLADEERFKAAHYLKHIDLFPEGQFVGEVGDAYKPELIVRELDLDKIRAVRDRWAFYRDRRPDAYDPIVAR